MFPANAQLDVFAGLPGSVACHFHELANALLINGGEWICCHDLMLEIGGQKAARIIPAHAEGRLGEVICAEAEELRVFGDLFGGEGRAGHFDHRADQIL